MTLATAAPRELNRQARLTDAVAVTEGCESPDREWSSVWGPVPMLQPAAVGALVVLYLQPRHQRSPLPVEQHGSHRIPRNDETGHDGPAGSNGEASQATPARPQHTTGQALCLEIRLGRHASTSLAGVILAGHIVVQADGVRPVDGLEATIGHRQVALHGVDTDAERPGDLVVRHPFPGQPQGFLLSWRESSSVGNHPQPPSPMLAQPFGDSIMSRVSQGADPIQPQS